MFDLTQTKSGDYDLLQPGTYVATITNTEIKISKAGNEYMNLTYDIVVGESKGRKLFEMINHKHDNPVVIQIAMSNLKGILMAVKSKSFAFNTESELFAAIKNVPMNIKVGIKKDDVFGDKNIIKGHTAFEEKQAETPMSEIPF